MTRLFLAYAATLLTFVALDFIWLGFLAKGYYQAQVGPLLLARPNWSAAVLLYLVYAAGIVHFVVLPAVETGSLARALGGGALLGLIVYATYDLTNLATLRGWTLGISVVDILWGCAVTAAAASAGVAVSRLAAAPA